LLHVDICYMWIFVTCGYLLHVDICYMWIFVTCGYLLHVDIFTSKSQLLTDFTVQLCH